MVIKRMGREGRGVRRPVVLAALESEGVRRAAVEGRTFYAVLDVVAAATDPTLAAAAWQDLLQRDPGVLDLCLRVPMPGADVDEAEELMLAADLEGVLRLLQMIESPRSQVKSSWASGTPSISVSSASVVSGASAQTSRAARYSGPGTARTSCSARIRAMSGATRGWNRRSCR